jgi:hypothetical protein
MPVLHVRRVHEPNCRSAHPIHFNSVFASVLSRNLTEPDDTTGRSFLDRLASSNDSRVFVTGGLTTFIGGATGVFLSDCVFGPHSSLKSAFM